MPSFRNIGATPNDPVVQWGFEGLLAAIERGSMRLWDRIATEVREQPYGAVARLLAEEVIAAVSHAGGARTLPAGLGASPAMLGTGRKARSGESTALVAGAFGLESARLRRDRKSVV